MTGRLFAALFVLTPFLAAGAMQPGATQEPTPSATAAATGEVDLEDSYVVIFVDKEGLGHTHAVMGRLSEGQVRLGAKEGAGRLVFDMTSFVADPAEAWSYLRREGTVDEATAKKVTASMLGRRVLDTEKYPTATFEIKSATLLRERNRDGHPRYALQGDFTLHGVTKPLTINADAVPAKDRVRLRGAFYLRQTEYGIKPFSAAFGAIAVADRLTVYGEIYVAK